MTTASIDLDVVLKRTAKDNPELTASDLKRAESEYKNYWQLIRLYPGQAISPTGLADKVWHAHILFTEKYARDCQTFFGYFLHHNPFGDDASTADSNAIEVVTEKLYEVHFGPWPENLSAASSCFTPPAPKKSCFTPPAPRGPAPGHEQSVMTETVIH